MGQYEVQFNKAEGFTVYKGTVKLGGPYRWPWQAQHAISDDKDPSQAIAQRCQRTRDSIDLFTGRVHK